MTQAPELARPDVAARAQQYLDGHITGLEGREDEFSNAIIDAVRTLTHNKPYPHQVNDALVKSWLAGIRFARKHDLMEDYIADSVNVMRPILDRMGALAAESGQREVILEAICGWSTCHHQLVITETYKEPGRRTFLSPFKRVLDAGRVPHRPVRLRRDVRGRRVLRAARPRVRRGDGRPRRGGAVRPRRPG